MTTADLKLCTTTLLNLNAATSYSSAHVPTATSGTYALINDMISDLSSIKASLKTEEKLLIAQINTTVAAGSTVTDPLTVTASANLSCQSGIGGEDTVRYSAVTDVATTALHPAILGALSTNEYAESVVFSVLAEAAIFIRRLKNNHIVAAAPLALTDAPQIAA